MVVVTLHTFGPHEVGSKYHVEYPVLKHVENSPQGIRHCHRRRIKTNDLDMLPDKVLSDRAHDLTPMTRADIARHLRNDHWPDPFRHDGFRDPKHKLGVGHIIEEMYPHEIDRLVAGHWPNRFHIPYMEDQLALCAELNVQALVEPKRSHVFKRQEVWDYLASVAAQHGTHMAVYSLMHECLPFARKAGFEAWPIN